MRENLFIGELSAQTGLPTQTIRYYEKLGLLEAPGRTEAHYRVYGTGHLERLQFIMQAKTFGLTLDEIKQLIDLHSGGETPCGHLRDMVKRHLDKVERQIRELTAFRGELLRRYETVKSATAPGKICGFVEAESLTGAHQE